MIVKRRIVIGGLLLVGLLATTLKGQTSVAFALVPKIGDGLSPATAFRPKYTDPGNLGAGLDLVGWQAKDYGLESAMLLRVNLSPEQRTALQAMPDAMVLPANLDANVSALALPTIQSKLEAVNLPADWITTDFTYRQVLRAFRRVITFMQRYRGRFGRLFGGGVTLDTQLNQLSATVRQQLASVADELGLDRSGITTTMTLRAALRVLAQQLPDDAVFDGN